MKLIDLRLQVVENGLDKYRDWIKVRYDSQHEQIMKTTMNCMGMDRGLKLEQDEIIARLSRVETKLEKISATVSTPVNTTSASSIEAGLGKLSLNTPPPDNK